MEEKKGNNCTKEKRIFSANWTRRKGMGGRDKKIGPGGKTFLLPPIAPTIMLLKKGKQEQKKFGR